MSTGHTTALEWLDGEAGRLDGLSRRIWDHAEIALRETRSSAVLADELETHGFRVERGVSGMPTAFVASWGEGGPTIGFLAMVDGGRITGVDERALLADAQTEAERLWASVPEWHWQKPTADEFSPPSFPRLESDLG